MLREHLESKRIRFTDDQRRRLAAKAKVLGQKVLRDLDTLVTPDTLLATVKKGREFAVLVKLFLSNDKCLGKNVGDDLPSVVDEKFLGFEDATKFASTPDRVPHMKQAKSNVSHCK